MRASIILGALSLTWAVACGNSFGTLCTTDDDCHGLECVQPAGSSGDGGCVPAGAAFCSQPCSTDADCASLGTGYLCSGGVPCQLVCVKHPPV
jgi:hypothetical protein